MDIAPTQDGVAAEQVSKVSDAELTVKIQKDILDNSQTLTIFLNTFWDQPDSTSRKFAIMHMLSIGRQIITAQDRIQLERETELTLQELANQTPIQQDIFEKRSRVWLNYVSQEGIRPIMFRSVGGRQLLASLNEIVEKEIDDHQIPKQTFIKETVRKAVDKVLADFQLADSQLGRDIRSNLIDLVDTMWHAPPNRYYESLEEEASKIANMESVTVEARPDQPPSPSSDQQPPISQEKVGTSQITEDEKTILLASLDTAHSLSTLINYFQNQTFSEKYLVFPGGDKLTPYALGQLLNERVLTQQEQLWRDINSGHTDLALQFLRAMQIQDFVLDLPRRVIDIITESHQPLSYDRMIEDVKNLSIPDFINWLQANPDRTVLGHRKEYQGNPVVPIRLKELIDPLKRVQSSQNFQEAITVLSELPYIRGLNGKMMDFIKDKYPQELAEAQLRFIEENKKVV